MSFLQGTGENTELNLHGVAGIKHHINNKGRVMTLTFFVSCSNYQNIAQWTEKQFNNSCEHSDPNSMVGSANDSCFKWLLVSDMESFRETVKEDVCNWMKKASKEGNLI